MNDLFMRKEFTMHAGGKGFYKIECDALTDEEIETFALIISKKVKFGDVFGIPTGGTRIEQALIKYRTPDWPVFLIVDDVFTTGMSMEATRKAFVDTGLDQKTMTGVVLFARNKTPDWIQPVFQMWGD